MGELRNTKHEAFANLIAKRAKTKMSITACYIASGYNTDGHAAEASATRLLSSAEVQRRISEINAPVVLKSRVTIESLRAQFDAVFDSAMAKGQLGAAGAAAQAKAKMFGFMRDQLEVGGVGDFEACKTPEDVVDCLIDGSNAASVVESLRLMLDLAEERAARAATQVDDTALTQRAHIAERPRRSMPWHDRARD